MIKRMGSASMSVLPKLCFKGTGKMINAVAMGNRVGRMAPRFRGSTGIIRKMAKGSLGGLMAISMSASSKITEKMGKES